MHQPSFSLGNTLYLDDNLFTIIQIKDNRDVLLESGPSNFKTTNMNDLLDQYAEGRLSFYKPGERPKERTSDLTLYQQRNLTDYPSHVLDKAILRRSYIEKLLEMGSIEIDRHGIIESKIAEVAVKLGDTKPPHKTTVFRWLKRYEKSGHDRRAFIPNYRNRGGSGQSRKSKEEEAIAKELVDTMYLKRQPSSIRDLAHQMELVCKRENEFRIFSEKLSPFSESTFRRHVRKLDPFDVAVAQYGPEEARRRFRSNNTVPASKRLLEIVEIDHTPLDLFVVDTKRGYPCGRPTLTMAICRLSKMPWGMHIGFDDCSAEAVLGCIEHGLKPKTYVKRQFPEITNDWPVFGVPTELRCDNGLEFHSKALRDVTLELGIELAYCPKNSPNWKGSIEAFLKRFNYQLSHKLPGTSLAKYFKRKDYDPLKAAVIDFEELDRITHLWLIEIYMNDYHRSLHCSPRQAWSKGII